MCLKPSYNLIDTNRPKHYETIRFYDDVCFFMHVEYFLLWHVNIKLQANHAVGKIKYVALKTHRFSRERAERKVQRHLLIQFWLSKIWDVKALPEFSCFCEARKKGKDKQEGTSDMTCANNRFIDLEKTICYFLEFAIHSQMVIHWNSREELEKILNSFNKT